MRRLKHKIVLHSKQLFALARKKSRKTSFIHDNVPYFSQWESPELVEKIITKKINAKDDPNWRSSGARDQKEYEAWSWSGCGMACLKMIVAHTTATVIPLVTLGKKCVEYGGYQLPLETSPGLFYKPFVQFVRHEYQLNAKAVSALTITEIKETLSNGGYAMVSVTPEIRFPAIAPKRRGGHLVLIFGYDDTKRVVYLHNPSGFATADSQQRVVLSYSQFEKFFDHKGILIAAR